MTSPTTRSHEQLATTLATWVFQLSQRGVAIDDTQVAAHCAAVAAAADPESGNTAARALVEGVSAVLAGPEPAQVLAWARGVFGARASSRFGEDPDREERAHRVRKYQFARGLPWLARVWERAGGEVRPGWLLIDRMTDEITAADPDPWNEIEEERRIPLGDFLVLWELADSASIHVA
jgi:hypothetical protein